MRDAHAPGRLLDHAGAAEIHIVVADDHPVVRRGLRLLLDEHADLEVVAEAGDLEEARRYVLGHRPDVLVLDLNMPGGSSLEAIPTLTGEFPETRIVVLRCSRGPRTRSRRWPPARRATSSSRQATASWSRRSGSRRPGSGN